MWGTLIDLPDTAARLRAGRLQPAVLEASATPSPGQLVPAVKPEVSDPKLNNIVDNLHKGVSNPQRVGDGTTADAVRHERRREKQRTDAHTSRRHKTPCVDWRTGSTVIRKHRLPTD